VFTERDLRAATQLLGRAELDSLQVDRLIQQVQTVSGSMARIAAVEADAVADVIQRMRESGMPPDEVALALVDSVRWDDLAELIDYEHRVQLRAAIWRRLTLDAAPDTAIGVGFADLAGYTNTTRHLEPHEIAALVTRWEDVAFDVVTAHGARVVKTIGDEVMFVGLPDEVVAAALALCKAAATDPALLSVRGAVAAGPVVSYNGDFYGPVVNLASRLTDLAKADEILAAGELRPLLADDTRYQWVSHGVHRLRGIGAVETFALKVAG
jgi:adenylate cyclase